MDSKLNAMPDDAEPSQNRQVELTTAATKNVAAGRSPYAGIQIRTRGELVWVMRQHDWEGGRLAQGRKRANLSRAILRKVNLSDVYLYEADLSNARLEGTDFSNAHLGGANINNADLVGANLGNADLAYAKLDGARIYRANLDSARLGGATLVNAKLEECYLKGTDLRHADLRGANLKEAKLDTQIMLAHIKLDTRTYLGDVTWNGALLVRVDWSQAPRLGDECAISTAKSRTERIKAYRDTARAYRCLSIALRDQGLLIPASTYRLLEQRMERYAYWDEHKIGSWLFSFVLDVAAGYGERPRRPFFIYLVVLISFTVGYYEMSSLLSAPDKRLRWYEALVLSVSAFHGRGFFQVPFNLGDPIVVLSACEALIGLFIELIFIATFSRRFLSS